MKIKAFEVFDSGTHFILYALKLKPRTNTELAMLRNDGFGSNSSNIAVFNMSGGHVNGETSAYNHGFARTRQIAHLYIEENFDGMESGDIIDVEFLLKETDKPRESELI